MSNSLLTLIVFLICLSITIALYYKTRNSKKVGKERERITLDYLLNEVSYSLSELIKDEMYSSIDNDDWNAMWRRKNRIEEAMVMCQYGILSAKIIVEGLINGIIGDILKTEEELDAVIDLNSSKLETRIKAEILIYSMSKEHGRNAFKVLCEEYDWLRPRYLIEDKTQTSYAILKEDIELAYAEKKIVLNYEEKLDILTTLIYQVYKGFGIIDTLREQNISGLLYGVSGSVLHKILGRDVNGFTSTRSIWAYMGGKYVHLRYLDFGTDEEMRRVTQGIIRYDSPAPLTEKQGIVVATMYDQTRVLAIRPPVGECWACWMRKFSLDYMTLENLAIVKGRENCMLPVELDYFLMQGEVTTLFTGRQGSGKTRWLTGSIKNMNPKYNLRLLEMTFEMFVREIYTERNSYTVKETDTVSAVMAQDALKKSDGAISISGEIATDPVAARTIQFGQIASVFTSGTHHGNTAENTIYGLRNSVSNATGMPLYTAEQQVVDVVRIDFHLDFDTAGNYFVERVTEIVKLPEGIPYPNYDEKNPIHSMNRATLEYYRRQTDRKTFETRDLMVYNKKTNKYEGVNFFTPELTKHIMSRIQEKDKPRFREFAEKYWPHVFKECDA